MPTLGLCVGSVVIIYFIHHLIRQKIFAITLLLGGNPRTSVLVYSMLFSPGVMVHELTHFMVASMLGVATGEINLLPRNLDSDQDRIALGSVKVAKTDFIRESLIGGAPFIIGLFLVYILVEIFVRPLYLAQGMTLAGTVVHWQAWLSWKMVLVVYGIAAITNTLFPSKEDARGWIPLSICLVLAITILLLTGSLHSFFSQSLKIIEPVGQAYLFCLGVVASIDLVLAGVLGLWQLVLERMTHKRVITSRRGVR